MDLVSEGRKVGALLRLESIETEAGLTLSLECFFVRAAVLLQGTTPCVWLADQLCGVQCVVCREQQQHPQEAAAAPMGQHCSGHCGAGTGCKWHSFLVVRHKPVKHLSFIIIQKFCVPKFVCSSISQPPLTSRQRPN